MQSTQSKKPKVYSNNNILESLKDLGAGVGRTIKTDVIDKSGSDILNSIFGQVQTKGELRPNETVEFGNENNRPGVIRPERLYQQPVRVEEQGLKQKIEEVRRELVALSVSIKNLNSQIEKTIKETPVDGGIYHLNFFERLKGLIMLLKEQVTDSASWLNLFTTYKKQKNFWGQFKKHGTSWGQSWERTVATSGG